MSCPPTCHPSRGRWFDYWEQGQRSQAHLVVKKSNKQSGDGFHIPLLHGINVGGKNILSMKDLAAMFCEAALQR